MCLTELRQDIQQDTPNANEEDNNEQQDSPLGNRCAPEEGPVTSVRSTKPVVTQDFGTEEPQHQLPTEEGFKEVGDLGRSLAVVICNIRLASTGTHEGESCDIPGKP